MVTLYSHRSCHMSYGRCASFLNVTTLQGAAVGT